MIYPDYTFERRGKPLEFWLWQLLNEEKNTRIIAGGMIQAMEWSIPSYETDLEELSPHPDFDITKAEFAKEVKRITSSEDFNTKLFVEKLSAYKISLSKEWQEICSVSNEADRRKAEKYERIAEKLSSKIDLIQGVEKKRAQDRLKKLTSLYLLSACDNTHDFHAGAEIFSAAGNAVRILFEILDREFLEAPIALAMLLEMNSTKRCALQVLEKTGPAAVSFVPCLLADLDDPDTKYFDGAKALGSIGCADPEIIEAVFRRIRSSDAKIRTSAIYTLGYMASGINERSTEICETLLPFLESETEYYYAVWSLAVIGRDIASVRKKIIELCRTSHNSENSQMLKSGPALQALVNFTDYHEECIPVLIEAVNFFEEYDPDMCYDGPLGRISPVVGAFGEKAADAVKPMVEVMKQNPKEHPREILYALAKIGPGASDAIPYLLEKRSEFAKKYTVKDLNSQKIDRDDDIYGWVIQKIKQTF